MQGKVEIAGVNTAKLKVLKNEETMELLRRTKAGDQEARRELIEGNLRLVLSVIQRFAGRGENADDLFQVGCVGLIKAIDNFDINQPVRFSTYGVPMIIGEIRRYLRDNSAIRVSRSMRDTAYKVLQVRDKYLAENQREPTVEQIAQELGIPREEVVFAMDAIVDPVSLYEPVYSDGGDAICVMDQVSDTRNTDEAWTDRIALKEAMKRLDDRERRILSLRFYEGKTQMEVSAEVGISQAQVSRLEKGAINTIKKIYEQAGPGNRPRCLYVSEASVVSVGESPLKKLPPSDKVNVLDRPAALWPPSPPPGPRPPAGDSLPSGSISPSGRSGGSSGTSLPAFSGTSPSGACQGSKSAGGASPPMCRPPPGLPTPSDMVPASWVSPCHRV